MVLPVAILTLRGNFAATMGLPPGHQVALRCLTAGKAYRGGQTTASQNATVLQKTVPEQAFEGA